MVGWHADATGGSDRSFQLKGKVYRKRCVASAVAGTSLIHQPVMVADD